MSQLSERAPPTARTDPTGGVGYRRPPKEHQFKTGVSGNPKGRPRKPRVEPEKHKSELHDVMTAELGRKIRGTENGKVRTMTAVKAIVRGAVNRALKGDRGETRTLLHTFRMLEKDIRGARQRSFDRQVDYKRRSAEIIRRCDEMGFQTPDSVPHPDDMLVDSKRQLVIFNGPADDIEKKEWDESEAERQDLITSIANLRTVLIGPEEGLKPYNGSRELVLELLDKTKQQLAALDATRPSEEQRRRPGGRATRHRAKSSCDKPLSELDFESCLKHSDEAITRITAQRAADDGSPERRAAAPADTVSEVEREAIVAERRKLTTLMSYLEEQLLLPEEALDPQFETHEDAGHLFEHTKEKLLKLDGRYPWTEQRQRSGSKLKQRQRRPGKDSDPQGLH